MAIREAIAQRMLDDAQLQALVGTSVYPIQAAQQDAVPYIVYQRLAGPRLYTHDGPVGIVRSSWQVAVWSETSDQAEAIAGHVVRLFNGFRGTVEGTAIQSAFIDNQRDLHDPDTLFRGVALTIRIDYEE